MLREKYYEWKNWKGVVHTTWNPQGPGVIRIHMIPPKFSLFKLHPSVVLINGQEIVPVYESWAILLTEFIRQINLFAGEAISEEEMEDILSCTCRGVREVYGDVLEERIRQDLLDMTNAFEQIAKGEKPEIPVDVMNIGEYAPVMTAPHRMDLMISAMEQDGNWNCNQHCLHCYAAGQKQSNTKEISTNEWKKIIEKCRKAKIPQLTFTGGEPTMREDLCELIQTARWFVTRLNTNGILLSETLCQKLREAELDSVQITFYDADAKKHNKLVGGDHYEQTIQGIKNALAAGLNLSINTPLCTINADYTNTLRFLKELGVTYVTCSGLIVTGNACKEDSQKTQLSKEELTEVLREAVRFCYANEMEIQFTSPGWIPEAILQEMGLDVPSCGAALSNMAVTPDGKVIPCQSWLSEDTLGDMRKDSWKKIWNSRACKKHRTFSAQLKQICPLRGEKKEMTHEK